MKLCLNANSINENLWPLIDNEPVALIKLAEKYLIEYLIESCTKSDIKSIVIVGGRHCDTLKNKLGTGIKWGVDLTYKDTLENPNDYFIINVDSLYDIKLTEFIQASELNNNKKLNDDTVNRDETKNTQHILKIHNYSSYHNACMKLVSSELSECMIDPHQFGYKVIEGARAVYNQENFTSGYSFIGDRTRVSSTSRLSSNVVIGSDVVIDDYAQINQSIIMDNTYIGKMLKVDKSIVKGNYLLSLKHDSCTKLMDKILIDDLSSVTNNKGLVRRFIENTLPVA